MIIIAMMMMMTMTTTTTMMMMMIIIIIINIIIIVIIISIIIITNISSSSSRHHRENDIHYGKMLMMLSRVTMMTITITAHQFDPYVGLAARRNGDALRAGKGARAAVVQNHAQSVCCFEGLHELFHLQVERHVQSCDVKVCKHIRNYVKKWKSKHHLS